MWFCFVVLAAGRWRWSLLVVAVMLLVCLTALIFYLLHDFVKSKCLKYVIFQEKQPTVHEEDRAMSNFSLL